MRSQPVVFCRTVTIESRVSMQCVLIWLVLGAAGFVQEPIELEHAWEADPRLVVRWVTETPLRKPVLKLEDFDSTVVAKRFEAARTALELSSQQMDRASDVLDKILSALERGEGNLRTRQVLVSAAAAMIDAENAHRLWPLAKKDAESRASIEDALIRIKSPQGLEHWRSVIESRDANPSEVARAIDGLAVCGQATDSELLRAYVKKQRGSPALMVHAAKAIGRLSKGGQLDLAKMLIESKYEQRFYLAALVLVQHQGDDVASVLRTIVKEGNGAAKQVAFESLTKIDRTAARELASQLVSDVDSPVRQTVVTFLASFEDRASFLLMAGRFADEIPFIRRQVRKELFRRSQEPPMRKLVDKIISQAIAAPQYEATEQAVILIVELSDMSREGDLLSLLEHSKPEVNIRAAWALSILAREEKTLQAMMLHAQSWTDKVTSPTSPIQRLEVDEQRIAFLLEAFGDRQFQDAESLLRLYIPKADGVKRLPSRTRLSGIWAIGKLYANRPDVELRKQFEDRVNDMARIDGELLEVRFVSAIALGRMGDKAAAETLSKYLGESGNTLHEASSWALKQFTAL